MHICLVHRDLHAITRGGICTVYRSLAPRLRAAGHDVTLLTQHTTLPVTIDGVKVMTLPRRDNMPLHQRAVTDALARIKPDVVECSSWEAEALNYARAPRQTRAPVVVRGDVSAATMGAADLAADERELLHLADLTLAVSSFASRDLAAAYGLRAPVVVANGVDRDLFQPGPAHPPRSGYQVTLAPSGKIATRTPLQPRIQSGRVPSLWSSDGHRSKVVWVGKITPMKGWDRLEALLPRLRPHAEVTILLGHSPAFCPTTLTGVDDVVILQDLADDDMPSLYRAADYLLCTSRWEGFGLAVAEALATGTLALVPADLGTADELLPDGLPGRYHSDDHLIELLTRRDRQAGHLPDQFDWDHNTAATLDCYRAAVEPAPAEQGTICVS